MFLRLFSSRVETLTRLEKGLNTQKITIYTEGLRKKNALLKEEGKARGVDSLANKKYLILSQILEAMDGIINTFNQNEPALNQFEETKAVLLIIGNLKRVICAVINKHKMDVLNRHRNNNQYYANAAYAWGWMAGGAALAGAMPLTAVGNFAFVFGLHKLSSGYLKGFDNYMPESLRLIFNFYKTLDCLENNLQMLLKNLDSSPTYYEILNVDKEASEENIRQSFRQYAKACHPDKKHTSDAADQFIKLKEAYDVLCNAEKRKEYDESLTHLMRSRV